MFDIFTPLFLLTVTSKVELTKKSINSQVKLVIPKTRTTFFDLLCRFELILKVNEKNMKIREAWFEPVQVFWK